MSNHSLEAILRTNPAMAGKKGYDKYGAPTVETKRKLRAAYEAKQNAKQKASNTSYPTDMKKGESMGDYYVRTEGGLGGKATNTSKKVNKNKTTKRKPVKGLSSTIKPKGVVDQDGNEIIKQPKKLKGIGTFKEFLASDKAIKVPELSSNKSKPVGQTTKMRRQSAREDRVARRRAARTARKNFRQGIGTDQAQLDANIALEKDRIKKRRAARNQYLRNFASQLARGEQASPRPTETPEGMKTENFFDSNKEKITDAQAATNQNAETEKTIIQDKLDKSGGDNQFMSFLGSTNLNLGNYGLGDSVKPMSLGDYQRSFQNLNPGIPKLDTEDSNPQIAMRKEYNKKRGL